MAQYGFRLYKTERMNGRGNTPVPFVDPKWGDFLSHVERAYLAQVGRKWNENPREAFDEDGNVLPLDPDSRILRLDWVSRQGMSLLFTLSSGKNDGYKDAMNAASGDADVSIEHLAPRRQFRGVYTLPPDQTEGVLALEAISRSCPDTVLTRWSNRWSEELVKSDQAVGKSSAHSRVKFTQVTDSAQVATLLREGDPEEIVLTEHQSRGDGLPDVLQYKLVAPVREKLSTMQTVAGWVGRDTVSKFDGIDQARALVGAGIGDVEFDDAYVSIRHEGQLQRVRPDAYSELFTYDNSSKQRDTGEFFGRVQDKLISLGLHRKMALELDDWTTSSLPELYSA